MCKRREAHFLFFCRAVHFSYSREWSHHEAESANVECDARSDDAVTAFFFFVALPSTEDRQAVSVCVRLSVPSISRRSCSDLALICQCEGVSCLAASDHSIREIRGTVAN